jgi:hypothetical protein
MFEEMDKDHNGFIDFSEFKEYIEGEWARKHSFSNNDVRGRSNQI